MLSHARLCWHILNLDLQYEATIVAAQDYLDGIERAEMAAEVPGHALPDGAQLAARLLADARRQGQRDLTRWGAQPDLALQRHLLMQCAPHALLTGCLLQNFNHAANCHEPIPALVHCVHSWQVGGGRVERNLANQYRRLLEQCGMHVPSIRSARFESAGRIHPDAWQLPAYQLSLSLFPHTRHGELLGAALFDLVAGIDQLQLPAPLQALVAASGYAGIKAGVPYQQACASLQQALDLALAQDGNRVAICRGFTTSLALYGKLLDVLAADLAASDTRPLTEMVRLMEKKAPYAVGYHSKLKLGKQPFETLLLDDAAGFVEQLGRSRWIVPGAPEASLLLTKLSAFGGPMYRVFSEDETATIAAWVRSLDSGAALPSAAPASAPGQAAVLKPVSMRAAQQHHARTLYHRLLNVEHCPQLRADALAYVELWFGRSAAQRAGKLNDMPFRTYCHASLRAWFAQTALTQAGSYVDQPVAADKSRQDVINDAVQLCPMVLIDGAWLQKWGNAGLVETPLGSLLYKIFSDEIGNGSVLENHPNIYRALIDQMQADLPDFRTRAFAFSERFDDDAFATPAFWLCLSQFPLRFLPETLGINLAMELSGVGSAYRTAKNELKHHGFSTLFVELHNTIDNVSSGHSAMAIEAIEHHMDSIMAMHDAGLSAQHWQRIWTGYCSLAQPERRWTEVLRKPRYRVTASA